jgi:hypothetical protein
VWVKSRGQQKPELLGNLQGSEVPGLFTLYLYTSISTDRERGKRNLSTYVIAIPTKMET